MQWHPVYIDRQVLACPHCDGSQRLFTEQGLRDHMLAKHYRH
jgi:hypothetical protein